MKKITGSDIVTIIRASIKNSKVLNEARSLSKDDFNNDDPCVKFFFSVNPNGFKTASCNKNIQELANIIEKYSNEILETGLRKAFSNIQTLREATSDAIKLESQLLENNDQANAYTQFKTASLLNSLSKYCPSKNKSEKLKTASSLICAEKFEEAGEIVKNVFAGSNPLSNVKLAFTTLKNQPGESYQLCPKGIYIWGQPRPMPLSDCREYCIDARLHQDGTVGCNYLNWLNKSLITQKQALNLFDTMKQAQDTMNLAEGERTKFPMSDQDPQDSFIIRNVEVEDAPWETKLARKHEKSTKSPVKKPAVIVTDQALETLLKDVRDVFDDQELDTLEEQLRNSMGE